jgi:hypothetical protein
MNRELAAKKVASSASRYQSLLAFTLSTLLQEKDLINGTAFDALAVLLRTTGIAFGASSEWKERLVSVFPHFCSPLASTRGSILLRFLQLSWKSLLKLHAFEVLSAATSDVEYPSCGNEPCNRDKARTHWEQAVAGSMHLFILQRPYSPMLRVGLAEPFEGDEDFLPQRPGPVCRLHRLLFFEQARQLEEKYMAALPSFVE